MPDNLSAMMSQVTNRRRNDRRPRPASASVWPPTHCIFACLLLFAWVVPAFGQEWTWTDAQGTRVADVPARKSIKGFGGWLLVTSDQDWEQKWNTHSGGPPQFTEATTVRKGSRIFVLIFFANPALSKAKEANVLCDIEVIRPDKSYSQRQREVVCFMGALDGPPTNLYLAVPVIGFVGEDTDPPGRWTVRVSVKDTIRGVKIPLEANFTLQR
jgi:hypothetical protein